MAESIIDLTDGLVLAGTAAGESLRGTVFTDTLIGLGGNDVLFGGDGNDTFLVSGAFGDDRVASNEVGVDRVLVQGFAANAIRLTNGLSNGLAIVVDGGGKINLDGHFQTATVESLAIDVNSDGVAESVIDLTGRLVLTGSAAGENLRGTIFDDTLIGLGGNDVLFGGDGNDTFLVSGAFGDDRVASNEVGVDRVLVQGFAANAIRLTNGLSNGLAVVVDGRGKINLDGHFQTATVESLAIDTNSDGVAERLIDLTAGLPLTGGAARDLLSGTAFDDTLDGRAGDDTLRGQDGNDTYLFTGRAFGHDTIEEDIGGAKDVASFSNLNLSTSYLARIGDSLVVSDKLGRISAEIEGQYDPDGLSVEKLQLGRAVTLDLARGQTFRGSAGDDDMGGTRFADTIIGNAGRDELDGGAGVDSYVFGPRWGQDTVSDIGKSFILFEGLTKSQLTFERNGSDLIITRNGSTDSLVLEDYHPARHIIRYVEAGFSKTIFGSGGGDVLWDGGGLDVFQGAGGRDQFVFLSANDSSAAKPDTILDFAGDLINLASFDIDRTTAGIQHFDYIGGRFFSGTAGELRFRGGRLEGDVDGDGDADLAVILMNRGALVAALDATSLILE